MTKPLMNDIKNVLQRYAIKIPVLTICQETGLGQHRVYAILLAYTNYQGVDTVRDKIYKMHRDGKTYEYIGNYFHIPTSYLSFWLRNLPRDRATIERTKKYLQHRPKIITSALAHSINTKEDLTHYVNPVLHLLHKGVKEKDIIEMMGLSINSFNVILYTYSDKYLRDRDRIYSLLGQGLTIDDVITVTGMGRQKVTAIAQGLKFLKGTYCRVTQRARSKQSILRMDLLKAKLPEFLKLMRAGYSPREIKELTGIPYYTTYLGLLTFSDKKKFSERRDEVYKLLREGVKTQDIAARIGINWSIVCYYKKGLEELRGKP